MSDPSGVPVAPPAPGWRELFYAAFAVVGAAVAFGLGRLKWIPGALAKALTRLTDVERVVGLGEAKGDPLALIARVGAIEAHQAISSTAAAVQAEQLRQLVGLVEKMDKKLDGLRPSGGIEA